MLGIRSTHVIKALVLGPNNGSIAAGSVDKIIRLFQMDSSGKFIETQRLKTKSGMLESVGSLALSPDAALLLSASDINGDRIHVWKAGPASAMSCIQTCKVKTLTASAEDLDVQSMVFGPDGRLAVGLTGEVAVCAVDVSSGTLRALHVFSTSKSAVKSLAWSPDGVSLAAGAEDGIVYVWKQDTHGGSGMQTAAMCHDASRVKCTQVKFSPDGELLVMTGVNGMMYVWKKDDQGGWEFARKVEREDGGELHSVAFQPNGQCVAVGRTGSIRIWNIVR